LPETTEDIVDETTIPDERLELVFTCCHPARAELLRRLDRIDEARTAYQRALELVHSDAERRFLERRLAELEG
jgi:RNA polymerase sigma-70 factor (ECF subfamily)